LGHAYVPGACSVKRNRNIPQGKKMEQKNGIYSDDSNGWLG
jgi:hypothetical protein